MKHRYSPTGQTTTVLNTLLSMKDMWVPLHMLMKHSHSGNVCNRVRDARKRGFTILNRVTQGPHGVKHSEYKLVTKKKA